MSRRKPERETRIPGLTLGKRVPKRAGPAGGNEAMSRIPMAGRTGRVRYGGAPFRSAATEICFVRFRVCRLIAAQPTLVVKISDASLHGKCGFESRL
jgi:hypothetical protein